MNWLRLEGSTRDPELLEGLAAHVADPLWAMARQLQVGEFHGEDAATPIIVTADVVSTPISAFAPGGPGDGGGPLARADADRPLEVMVEQEPVTDDMRLSLEIGWVLLRALFAAQIDAAAIGRLRQEYRQPMPADDGLDPVGRAELELLSRRSLDGWRLSRAVVDEARLSAVVAMLVGDGPEADRIRQAVQRWRESAAELVRLPNVNPSWRSGPLGYEFRVAAPLADGELTLAASEYRGRTLDWYHFRRASKAVPLGATGTPSSRHLTVLPAPVRFTGMPDARFWAIEDETVSFGDLVGGPEDLVRAVVGGFAAVYSNDWIVMPCHLRAGSVARVTSVTVHDDYGQRHDIPATAVLDGPDRVWRFFEVEGDDGPDAAEQTDRVAPLLLAAPALPDTEEGTPVERVDMIRDQVANLAWAIERRAWGTSGRTIDRDAASVLADPRDRDADWSYQAFSPVPENWIPLVPVRRGEGETAQVHLRRGRVAVPPPGVPVERLLPRGRILDARAPLRIWEAAIPDAGLRVDRRYQRARSADGRVHLWLGRRVRTGAWPAAGRFVADRLRRAR
jgi:hypothetical protein